MTPTHQDSHGIRADLERPRSQSGVGGISGFRRLQRIGALFVALGFSSSLPAADSARLQRGQELYVRNCFACHQLDGAGVPGIFPPLAKSDYLADIERSIRVVCEGLTGDVVVNGQKYSGVMPPIVLDDPDVADIFTYILNSWGNAGGEVSAETVARVRSRSRIKTFERLKADSAYPPLPAPPEGFTLREVARLPQKAARMASDGT